LTPIEWSVREGPADPQRLAARQIGKLPREGTVFVLSPTRDRTALRLSAVARCGDETPLLLGLIAAFSASEGIRKDTGIISWVRWPRFVTIDGRDVAATSASVTPSAASGVRWTQLDFRVNLSHTDTPGATSLYDALGVDVDRNLLTEKILDSLSWMHFGWSNGMHPQLLRRIRSMTETIGTRVVLKSGDGRAVGTALNIDADGRLEVRLDDGSTKKFDAADELSRS